MRRFVRAVLLTMWLLAVPRPTFAGEADPPWRPEKGSDPFTFWKELARPPPPPPPPAVTATAEFFGVRAERAIKDCKYGEAAEACDKGLKELGASQDPGLQELYERLFRLRLAADRLQKRADAEDAFRHLGLKVSGVVARRDHPLAIVNDKTVGKGALLETAEGEGTVYVDEIQPHRVIVRFRGYRIEVPFGPRE
jgi:hypothetical protein